MNIKNTPEKNYILTFGYGNRKDYDLFVEYLKCFNVNCVVDVRLTPRAWSRKWYGAQLDKFCTSINIEYISEPALGNTSGNQNWVPPDLEGAKKALLEISNIVKLGTILLLCCEKDFRRCHRVDVAKELQQLTKVPIKNLD
jgi:uncharacterized protein (DUF488 family)